MAGLVAGSPVTTAVGEVYLALPKHRGQPDQHRSVWTKPVPEEVACFIEAWRGSWGVKSGELWGHVSGDAGLQPLGRNGHNEPLWFAKFLQNLSPAQWHGYPADYRRNAQDRPPTDVLDKWRQVGALAKHQMLKIKAGRPCLP